MVKRVLMVALSIIFLIGLSSCIEKKEYTKVYRNEDKKEMVLTYLKDKYNEEFVGVSYSPKGWGQGSDAYYAYPKTGSEEDGFEVWGKVNKYNGNYEMTDGYFGVYIRSEYEKVMRGFIDEFFSDYKIYLVTDTSGSLPQRLNKNTKINEIYKKHELYGFKVDTYVCVKQSFAGNIDINDIAQKIALKMVENKLVGGIDINIVRDERYDLIKLDKENWKRVSSKENLVRDARLDVNYDLEIKNYRKMK